MVLRLSGYRTLLLANSRSPVKRQGLIPRSATPTRRSYKGGRETLEAHHFASFLLAAGSTGGGRTFGWSLGLCGLLGGGIGEIFGMFCESISYILVHTNGSFRVFIVAMNVLCDDVTL